MDPASRGIDKLGQGIHVAGYVKDPLPYWQQAGVFIVPLRAGGGMRVKILEALAPLDPARAALGQNRKNSFWVDVDLGHAATTI